VKLLLNPGAGWSATTPFLYTLSYHQKYCHCGHQKESGYLRKVYSNDFDQSLVDSDWNAPQKKIDSPMGRVLSVRNQYVKHFDPHFLEQYYKAPYTIQNYVEYYRKHWEATRWEYESVSDFSNFNFSLPIEFLQKIAPILQEFFEIKVTFQFRDPIRRFFSEVGSGIVKNIDENEDLKERIWKKTKNHKKLFLYKLKKGNFSPNCEYLSTFEKFQKVFGEKNCYFVVMEDFWTKKDELERLSDFLSYKITKIHENCYVPDLGSRAPRLEWLKDQWESDLVDIDEEILCEARTVMRPFYLHWQNKFGKLPDSWVDNIL